MIDEQAELPYIIQILDQMFWLSNLTDFFIYICVCKWIIP
jgi:hypothetical protein